MATGQAARPRQEPAAPFPFAGLQLRIVAFILDLIVLFSLSMLFVALAGLQILLRSDWGSQSDIPDSVFMTAAIIVLSYFLFAPFYFALLWYWKGQSVGQMAVHIKVVHRQGRRLSLRRALGRTLLLPLTILPLGLGLATVFFDREKRALHDYLTGTVVLELP